MNRFFLWLNGVYLFSFNILMIFISHHDLILIFNLTCHILSYIIKTLLTNPQNLYLLIQIDNLFIFLVFKIRNLHLFFVFKFLQLVFFFKLIQNILNHLIIILLHALLFFYKVVQLYLILFLLDLRLIIWCAHTLR